MTQQNFTFESQINVGDLEIHRFQENMSVNSHPFCTLWLKSLSFNTQFTVNELGEQHSVGTNVFSVVFKCL